MPDDFTFRHKGQYECKIYDEDDNLVAIEKAEVLDATEATKYYFPYPNENNYMK